MLMNRTTPFMVPVDEGNPAIIKDEALCSQCGHCFAICEEEIGVAAKEYLIEIEVRKYTPKTIRSYRNNLNLFLRFCTEHEITGIENVTLATVKQFTRAMTASKKKGTYINGILKA